MTEFDRADPMAHEQRHPAPTSRLARPAACRPHEESAMTEFDRAGSSACDRRHPALTSGLACDAAHRRARGGRR